MKNICTTYMNIVAGTWEMLCLYYLFSDYCWTINGFLEQINHHLAAVTGRTESKAHICYAQCLSPFLSYECE